jgi:hypothetical protein
MFISSIISTLAGNVNLSDILQRLHPDKQAYFFTSGDVRSDLEQQFSTRATKDI